MELTNINTTTKNPDTETEPPPPPQTTTNGSFPNHPPPSDMVVSYKECLKNHAASIGGHALDGCGEFMPIPNSNSKDPTSLKCAACGCHRNFHRRYPYQQPISTHYSLPPPPQRSTSPSPSTDPSTGPSLDPTCCSPQPVTSPAPCSYFSSAPHMLLALSSGFSAPVDDQFHQIVNKSENNNNNHPIARKRSRTKFTQEQKEKMYSFAEKLGWRMLKGEEKAMMEFCSDVGVSRRVFKVWMHNHKNAFGKRSLDINNNNNSNDVSVNLTMSPKSQD